MQSIPGSGWKKLRHDEYEALSENTKARVRTSALEKFHAS